MSSSSSSSTSINLNRIILVGAGDTTCTPSTTCLYSSSPCQNCLKTVTEPDNINNRNQTSILLQFSNNKSILVDCGLTFRTSVLKSARQQTYQFPLICGFIATRNCPDSILGSDDIREVTQRGEKIAFFATAGATASMNRMFGYIMPSKTVKTENQKNLWTAGLAPNERALKHGEKFVIPVGSNAEGAGEIEIVGVGKSGNNRESIRENCGFVISLEEDGRLKYPNGNGDNDDNERKSKVALYLPFDCLSSSTNSDEQQQDHYSMSTVDVLRHFNVELGIIACPDVIGKSNTVISENEASKKISDLLSGKEWKDIFIKKIVVCSIPHNVVVNEQQNDTKDSEDDEKQTNIVFGSDASSIWQRE